MVKKGKPRGLNGGRQKQTIEEKLSNHPVEMNMEKISKLYKSGWTDDQVAEFLGITVLSIHKWKRDNSFSIPLKDWKDEADKEVEASLYQSAKGYRTKYKKNFVVSDGKDSGSHVEQHEEEIAFAPNPTSAIFWLKNRKPKEWRDNNHNINLNGTVDDAKFCDEFFGASFDKK